MLRLKDQRKYLVATVIVILVLYLSFVVNRQSKLQITVKTNEQIQLVSFSTKINFPGSSSVQVNRKKVNQNSIFNPTKHLIKLEDKLLKIEQKEREKIRLLQQLLIELDYQNVEVTGYFDVKSKSALQQYFKDFNLRLEIEVTPEVIEQLRISKALYESTK
jgi:Holliday junction resolvase